jgi:hypothetical protein
MSLFASIRKNTTQISDWIKPAILTFSCHSIHTSVVVVVVVFYRWVFTSITKYSAVWQHLFDWERK